MSFARKLSFLRNRKGITQAELGRLISVTPQAVSKWENGISEPDIATLAKIARIFDVTVDYLLSDESEPFVGSDRAPVPTAKKPQKTISERDRRHRKKMVRLSLLLGLLILAFAADLVLLFSISSI